MRFMIMVKATADSEAGKMPTEQQMAEMGKFNQEMIDAGILVAADGLHPSSRGVRIRFSGAERTVVPGPFAATNELVAGFWIIDVASQEEAIAWIRRCPNPMNVDSDIEIRKFYEAADFGAEFTPELQAQEEQQRATVEAKNQQH